MGYQRGARVGRVERARRRRRRSRTGGGAAGSARADTAAKARDPAASSDPSQLELLYINVNGFDQQVRELRRESGLQ